MMHCLFINYSAVNYLFTEFESIPSVDAALFVITKHKILPD